MAKLSLITAFLLILTLNQRISGFTLSRSISSKGPRVLSPVFAAPQKAGGDKIRVRLLSDIKGTGRKGEILLVSAALWTNVLQPKKQAEKVSDSEIAEISAKKTAAANAELDAAQKLSSKITSMPKLTIKRKANASNGQLFGSVSAKQLIEIIRATFPQESSEGAAATLQIAVTAIKACDENGENCNTDCGSEVRKTGKYRAQMKLHPKVEVVFNFEVIPE